MSNNISHHDINKETKFQVNKKKHEAMKRKCQPKTKIQREKKVFWIFTGIWIFCQIISALLAATGFHYLATMYIQGDPFLVGSVVLGLSIALEVIFNELNKARANQKYDDETTVSLVIRNSILICLVVYGGTSFIGSPYTVTFWAAPPAYNDIEGITKTHDDIIKKDTLYYKGQVYLAQSSADAFKFSHGKRDCKDVDKCPWRLRTSALKPHAAMLGKVDSIGAIAGMSFTGLKADKKAALKEAKEENKIMKANHVAWCGSFGWGMSFVSVLCIGIFLVTYDWAQSYKRKEIIDNDKIIKKQAEAEAKTKAQEKAEIEKLKAEAPKVEVKGKGEGNPKVVVNEPLSSMQFATSNHKEGDIDEGEGRKHDKVYCKIGGKLELCTYGRINGLIAAQEETPKGLIRKAHLRTVRDNLSVPSGAVPK